MEKKFNITGTCIPEKHFMVDISDKLEQVFEMVENGEYFTINRPRQYGKTTTLYLLSKLLNAKKDYLSIKLSFEGMGSDRYENAGIFIDGILLQLKHIFKIKKLDNVLEVINKSEKINSFDEFGYFISDLVSKTNKNVVLMIDEVDKSSNNQLFLDFLGMLRAKYLLRNEGEDITFQSVILAGVHDIKNLKLKLRPEDEKKYNSPWNIAADFKVDLSFNKDEIALMMNEYSKSKNKNININEISEKLHYYTSGYPFLVSKLCKTMDEEFNNDNTWEIETVNKAVNKILQENNTNFGSLIKNLENNKDLYELVNLIIIDGAEIAFNRDNALIDHGVIYGIFRDNGIVKIHNRIYEQRIYNYMSLNLKINELIRRDIDSYSFRDNFISNGNTLDFEKLLLRFQDFIKKEHSAKDQKFLERNGRLIFLAFLKPVLNGYGYDFKEVQISEEKRLDVLVVFSNKQYVVELKIWRCEAAHKKGIGQLCGYLDRLDIDEGYLVIFDFTKKKKEWKHNTINEHSKKIFIVWV